MRALQLAQIFVVGEMSAISQLAAKYGATVFIAACVDCVPKELTCVLSASVGFQNDAVIAGVPATIAPSTPPTELSGPRTALRV